MADLLAADLVKVVAAAWPRYRETDAMWRFHAGVRMQLPRPRTEQPPFSLGAFVAPDFPLLSLSLIVETLRTANRLTGQVLYEWHVLSARGGMVAGSNLIRIETMAAAACPRVDMVAVIAGSGIEGYADPPTAAWLRRQARAGSVMAGISGGQYILAQAGLLNGRRCTIHWEQESAFAEAFPALDITQALYVWDGRVVTTSGGGGTLEMVLQLIADQHGSQLATDVAASLIYAPIRQPDAGQRPGPADRLGIADARLAALIGLMEAHIEQPLDMPALGREVGISVRQIERLFGRFLDTTPARYYLRLRLEHARTLLQQSRLPVIAVAIACGFESPSHFAHCFRRQFGCSPGEERAARGLS